MPVAVRSSATAEDSEAASFAGQQETYLHVRGVDEIVERIRDCWCSFFTERALFYRSEKGSLTDLGMAVVVQRMVQPDVAGVMFTIDPTKGRRDRMVVEAVFGLGEGVVSGQLTPDHYVARARRAAQAHAAAHAAVRDRPRPRRRHPRGAAATRARRGADARRGAARPPREGRDRARGAARRPAGHRVGDPGRRALRPAVAPGDRMTVGTQAIRVINPATEEDVGGLRRAHPRGDRGRDRGRAPPPSASWRDVRLRRARARRPRHRRGPARARRRVRPPDHDGDGQAARPRPRPRSRSARGRATSSPTEAEGYLAARPIETTGAVELRRLRAARRRAGDHAVELPVLPGRALRRPGADGRQRRAAQARSNTTGCALAIEAGVHRGGAAVGTVPRAARRRRRGGRGDRADHRRPARRRRHADRQRTGRRVGRRGRRRAR